MGMGFGAEDQRCCDFERDNEPCTLPVLAERASQLYCVDVETIARMTTLNAQRFYDRDFGIRQEITPAPQVLSQPSVLSVSTSRDGLGATAASSSWSNNEKEVLKLAKKFREIVNLEEKFAGASDLSANQKEKLARKGAVAVDFLATADLLLPTSSVFRRVQDVMSALNHASNSPSGSQPATGISGVEVPSETNVNATPGTGNAADGQDGGRCHTETSADAQHAHNTPEQRERRWRPRGGRSGFERRYVRDHLQ